MAIITGVGTLFLEELGLGAHVLSEGSPDDTIKVALYGPNAVLDPKVNSVYTTFGEVAGGGYTAGGITITGLTVVGRSGSARAGGVQFSQGPYIQPDDDAAFTVVGVGVRGCLMYNASQGNRTIFVLDFGETLSPSTGLQINWGLAGVVAYTDTLIPLQAKTL